MPTIAGLRAHRAFVTHHSASPDPSRLLTIIARSESGGLGYIALNLDDHGQGVSFGRFQFNQGQGALGLLFARFYRADPARFVALTYGDNPRNNDPDALARRLIDQLQDRSQCLAGSLARRLIEPIWRARLRALGQDRAFRVLQDELAAEIYLAAARRIADDFGLVSERALALLFDMSIQHGPTGARRYVARALRNNPRNLREMRRSDAALRPVEEHDILVLIAQETERAIPRQFRRSLVRRREAVLRDAGLSDRPSPLLVPTGGGMSIRAPRATPGRFA